MHIWNCLGNPLQGLPPNTTFTCADSESLAKSNIPPGLFQLAFRPRHLSTPPACGCVRIVLQDSAVGTERGRPPPSGAHGSQGAWEGGGVESREREADAGRGA